MPPSSDDVYKVLQSIDASLKALCGHLGAFGQGASHPPAGLPDVPAIASDADLDGKYGDPPIRAKDPKDWTGESQLGKPMSQCPPEYLDLVAARLDYFAGREEDPKKARYNRLDAARARGWAQRLRNGWKPEPTSAFGDQDAALTADEIPFALILCAALGHALISVLC